jgi:hypothetical protein
MAAPAPPAQEQKGMLSGLTDAFDSATKAMGLKKDELTPPGVAPEAVGETTTGGRRYRKTRKGKRSTRRTTRRVRKGKGKKGGRKH